MRVSASKVSVRFGDVMALNRVSLSARSRQMVAIMGPSGAGKSTLLGVISGEIMPTQGSVTVTPSPGIPAAVAWIFQSSPMLDRRSALENTALGAIARGDDPGVAYAAAASVLTGLRLGDRLHTLMYNLSGGERQRVAVARAMVSRASLILADEPTASLDSSARQLVVDSLMIAAAAGAVVLVATHDAFVADQCDRTVELMPADVGHR